jgi:glycosyltransferase involved in cell wall biosynthesis
VLSGILTELANSKFFDQVHVAVYQGVELPGALLDSLKIKQVQLSGKFGKAELMIGLLTSRHYDVFISPYPKLPLWPAKCKFVNIVHDVFYITNQRSRSYRYYWPLYRLKSALRKASLTWYDSECSKLETERLTGWSGANPRVRHPGLDPSIVKQLNNSGTVLKKYGFEKDYILVLGNGLPHKNLNLMIELMDKIERPFVFAGVANRIWKKYYSHVRTKQCKWLEFVPEQDLASIIANAFCLAQPSLQEGFGYPPLEAMALATPAIISDIPVLKETTGGHALVASVNRAEDWLAKIRYLETPHGYQEQVERGLNWVRPFLGRGHWQRYVMDLQGLLSSDHGQ